MRLVIICNILILCLLSSKVSLAIDEPPYPDQYSFASCREGAWVLDGEEVLDGQSPATLSCVASGVGTSIGGGYYEVVSGSRRVVEKIVRGQFGSYVPYNGGGYINVNTPSQQYIADMCKINELYAPPFPNYPGCITADADALGSCAGWPEGRCVECSETAANYNLRPNYTFFFTFNTVTLYRANYHWECSDEIIPENNNLGPPECPKG